jgi:hypothetical protein
MTATACTPVLALALAACARDGAAGRPPADSTAAAIAASPGAKIPDSVRATREVHDTGVSRKAAASAAVHSSGVDTARLPFRPTKGLPPTSRIPLGKPVRVPATRPAEPRPADSVSSGGGRPPRRQA